MPGTQYIVVFRVDFVLHKYFLPSSGEEARLIYQLQQSLQKRIDNEDTSSTIAKIPEDKGTL